MKINLSLAACGIAVAGIVSMSGPAAAEFPEQPIRIIVPFAAGGGVDVLARPFAQAMSEIVGQSVVVENRPSATGEVGAMAVAQADPDGYTLLLSSAAFGTTPAFYPESQYSPLEDFEPVTVLARAPQILVAANDFGADTVEEILEIAASGDSLNVGLTGATGIQALSTYLMSALADVEMSHIPYPGAGAAFADLMSGRIDFMFDNPGSSLPYVQNGSIKLIATTGLERSAYSPDTPTIAETLSGFESANWFVLAAPAGTPDEVLDTLNAAAVEAINRDDIAERLTRDGTEPLRLSREDAATYLADEIQKWTQVVEENGLEVQ